MLNYSNTTVFNVGAKTLVNTINCYGVMGAGLALEFKLRYPEMYEDYVQRCKRKEVSTGQPYLYQEYEDFNILNFPTKKHWKDPSKIEWIEEGLGYFVDNHESWELESVAFPKLGCDRGGLDWNDVQQVIETYLANLDIDIYICLDKDSHATGIEGIMVDMINSSKSESWISELGIRKNIADNLVSSLPVKRFRQLIRIRGVGKQTYGKLFQFFYKKAQASQLKDMGSGSSAPLGKQLTLPID